MLIPVFPQMKQAMSLSQFQVGLIVTFFSIPAGLLIPWRDFCPTVLAARCSWSRP